MKQSEDLKKGNNGVKTLRKKMRFYFQILIVLIFTIASIGYLPTIEVQAAANGTADGTYDFGGIVGNDNSAGPGFATFSDKFVISNGFAVEGTQLYTTNFTQKAQQTLIIKAEGGNVCKTFTFKDLGVSLYNNLPKLTFNKLTLVVKDTNGATLGTHSISNDKEMSGGGAIYQLSALLNGGSEFNYNGVASLEITWQFDSAVNGPNTHPSNLNFENIKIVNVSATEPVTDSIPPTVSNGTISSSNISTTEVKLDWAKATDNITAQGDLEYRVYQSSSNNIDTVSNIEANGTALGSGFSKDIATFNVTGLSPSTTYYFNVIVKDAAGNKSAYMMKQVTTASPASAPTVTTSTPASNVTTTGATVGGDVTADGGATITERGIVYATTANPTTSNSKVTATGSTGIFTANLSGLSPNTTYYYRAYATNSEGTSYGSNQTFTTTAPSNNANLSSLTLLPGTLNPMFAAGTTSYTASVASNVANIQVIPTVADSNATVTVNGAAVGSGQASGNIALNVGSNTISIVVTAQDSTTKTYTITVTRATPNSSPTDISLSSTVVGENQPVGTVVGTLSATDPDVGDTITYSLVSGTGDTDNASFSISGNQLKTNASFDYETKNSYSVRVRATDSGGLTFEKTFTINVIDVNEAPTDVSLSASSVEENQPVGTVFGALSAVDPDAGDVFVYSFTSGLGDTDNGSFTISGNELRTNASFDYETKNSYSVRIGVTDSGGLTFEKQLTITIIDVNEDPIPTLVSMLPADDATNILVNTDLIMTFSEAITAVAGKNISIYKSDNSLVQTIAADSSVVTINGSAVTINLPTDLMYGMAYYVQIDAGAFEDSAHQGIQGISNTTTWNFTTVAPSTNADLSNLVPSNGTLDPAFATETSSYTANVVSNVENIQVTPTVADSNATVTVNGAAVVSGQASGNIALNVGDNTITIVVTAQDGTTTKTYTITVNRAAPTYTIDAIGNQTFTVLTTGYTSGTQETKTLIIKNTGTGNLANVAVALSGTNATDFDIVQPQLASLMSGDSTTFTVKARDGLATGTYTALVTVSADNLTPVTFTVTQVVNAASATAPGAPTNVTATAGNGQATVSFDTPTNNGGSPITDYTVKVYVGGVEQPALAKTGVSSPITVTGLTNGTAYTFKVIATNSAGSSGESAESSEVTPTAPVVLGPTPNPDSTPTPSIPNTQIIVIDVVDNTNPNAVIAQMEIIRTTENGRVKDTVSFTREKALESVRKLEGQEPKASRIVIPDATGIVAETVVNVPQQAVSTLANGKTSLSISTSNFKIFIPNTSLENWKDDLYFRMVPVKESVNKEAIKANAIQDEQLQQLVTNTATISILGNPMTIETNMQNHLVTITLPLPANVTPQQLEQLAVYIQHSDGTTEVKRGKIVEFEQGIRGVKFDVDYFSTFTVLYTPDLKQVETVVKVPYIQGYADGTFRPNANVTRAQMATMLARYLTNNNIPTAHISFTDVTNHGAKDAIEFVKTTGLFNGTTETMFNPNGSITRAEMASTVVRWIAQHCTDDVTKDYCTSGTKGKTFNDVDSKHWAASAIEKVSALGIMTGNTDTTFNPNGALTRAQAVKILNRLFEKQTVTVEKSMFTDVPATHWAIGEIEAAATEVVYEIKK